MVATEVAVETSIHRASHGAKRFQTMQKTIPKSPVMIPISRTTTPLSKRLKCSVTTFADVAVIPPNSDGNLTLISFTFHPPSGDVRKNHDWSICALDFGNLAAVWTMLPRVHPIPDFGNRLAALHTRVKSCLEHFYRSSAAHAELVSFFKRNTAPLAHWPTKFPPDHPKRLRINRFRWIRLRLLGGHTYPLLFLISTPSRLRYSPRWNWSLESLCWQFRQTDHLSHPFP